MSRSVLVGYLGWLSGLAVWVEAPPFRAANHDADSSTGFRSLHTGCAYAWLAGLQQPETSDAIDRDGRGGV